jgi:hypothetical protein
VIAACKLPEEQALKKIAALDAEIRASENPLTRSVLLTYHTIYKRNADAARRLEQWRATIAAP